MNITYKVKDEIDLKVLKKYGYTLRRKNGFEKYEKLVDHKRKYIRGIHPEDKIYYICIPVCHRNVFIDVYTSGTYGLDIWKDYTEKEIEKYIKDLLKDDLLEEVKY